MTKKIKIPWQGVTLGVFNIGILLLTVVVVILGSSAFLQAFIMSQNQNIAAVYLDIFSVVSVASYLMVIIEVLLILGYFYGKRLTVIIGLAVVAIEILMNIVSMGVSLELIVYNLGGLVFLGFLVWLSLSCLKHPFYGGDGKLSVDTFKFWRKRKNVNSDDMTTF